MVGLEILFAGLASYLRGKGRCGRLLVPANFLQVITNVLLVERLLRPAGPILICRPQAGRVGSQHLIRQSDAIACDPELKLGIGDNDPFAARVSGGLAVNLQADVPQFAAQLRADEARHLLKGDVLVVAVSGLVSRGKNRLWQLPRFLQAGGQLDTANRSSSFVLDRKSVV